MSNKTKEPFLRVYTDGSVIKNPGNGSCGFVVIDDDKLLHEHCECHKDTTNNRMEMIAVYNAMQFLQMEAPGEKAVIFCDSTYVVNGINDWRAGWKKKGWAGVKNSDLWQKLDEIADENPRIYINWIRGHNGDKWNEYTDRLCAEASKAA